MGPRRFYTPKETIQGNTIILPKEESHHLTRVLRLQVGDEIEVFDGAGSEYRCRLDAIGPAVRARIVEAIHSEVESPIPITLVQALTKFDKFDYIVQKATEIGVAQIVPVVSQRTEIRWSDAKANARVARWQKIACESVKQCRRSVIPAVQPVTSLAQALAERAKKEQACKLCLAERGGRPLRTILPPNRPSEFIVVVGPEGGWSDTDLATAIGQGYQLSAVGPRILRTETAALVALSILQYQFGDLG